PTTREPDAITNLSARVSDTRIILSWSAPYDGGESIDHYRIYRSLFPSADSFFTSTYSTSYTDTTPRTDTTYYYRVSAVNRKGESSLSNIASARVSSPVRDTIAPVSTITFPSAGSLQKSNFSVRVEDTDEGGSGLDTCYYSVFSNYSQTVGAGGMGIARPCNSFISVSVGSNANCRHNGTNICRVYVDSKDKAGNWSRTVSRDFSIDFGTTIVQPEFPRVPNQITNLSAQVIGGFIHLSWSAPYDGGEKIDSYKIYRGFTSSTDSFLATSYSASYTDYTAATGTTYYYRVSAVNRVGESILSNIVSIKIILPPVPALDR
ncbi:MAG: fibronectin type III domain-containing protein, partial [Patescibacteria group bacterium]|nr:fibronectin type III domain-containing protein [Patescibacteria group bacterium]